MNDSKRLFLAIRIKSERSLTKVFNQLSAELKHEKIKWVNPDNLHLTLKFFGETPVKNIDSLISGIKEITDKQAIFKMKMEKVGVFGSNYQPKVIWTGFSAAEKLRELEAKVSRKLAMIGYKNDRQNFVPHLTLGRIKYLQDKALFQEIIGHYRHFEFQEVVVEKIVLFESILKSSGPEYHVIHEFYFGQ